MPIKSRWSIPISETSLPTWLFGSPTAPLPDKRALIDADQPDTHFLTLSAFRSWSMRVAAGLRKAGLQKGDRVLLFSGNNIFFPVVFMGIVMAGGIFTGANPTYVARELAYQLKDSGAKYLVCADGSLDVGLEAAAINGMSKDRVFIFDDLALEGAGKARSGVRNWTALIGSVQDGERFVWEDTKTPKDTTAALNYSSGTTGVPKGVQITHRNFIANAEQVMALVELRADYQERIATEQWLGFLPMYHAYGQTFYVTIGPKIGIPVYIMPKFDFTKLLQHIQDFKITSLNLAPPIAVKLAKDPEVKKYDLSSILNVGCGAAPLSQEVAQQVNQLWPGGQVNLKQGWGMTETTCSVMGWDPNQTSSSACVGELLANCEAKIMNDAGTAEVSPGQAGELWVRAPNIMKGYWRNEKATKETLTKDRWLKTGDVCFADEHNRFTIVDRKKELIKVKGNQVAPAELEGVLMGHEAIADTGVVGVAVDGDERPRAYVVLKQSHKRKIGEKEVKSWMDSRVSRFKRLTGGVVFVDEIPKNPSGKILRKELRDRAKREVGDSEKKGARL